MSRRSLLPRWTLSLLMLAALFFGALGGQSLTRVDAAPQGNVDEYQQNPISTPENPAILSDTTYQKRSVQPKQKDDTVAPAPLQAVDSLNVLISEFRFLGPEGGNDEFIELFNPSNAAINITGWKIMGSNNSGGTSSRATLGSVTLAPGQRYLLVNSSANAGLLALADATYSSGITDDGGIALTDGINVIDAVGLSSGSAYKEGTVLSPLSGTAEQSYERKNAGNDGNCVDTNNNVADFIWNSSSSNPQNTSNPPLVCLTVTNVTSSLANGTYSAGQIIPVSITFSGNVNVTGTPSLLLETGTTNRNATYVSGDGSNTLIFNYTVVAGDSSSDLEYASSTALSLNGGSIIGAIGDATLILPMPGQTGSLSANRDIRIDSTGDPTVSSFRRQVPSVAITNSDSLTFRVTFSEAVLGVSLDDFLVVGVTSPAITINPVNGSVYDVVVSGGNLASLNGIVELNLSGSPTIQDTASNLLIVGEPGIDEKYTVDNNGPNVTVDKALGQSDPATTMPVFFTVVFSEPIIVGTFTPGDITTGGTVPFVSWSIVDSGDQQTFTLSAITTGNGTITPSIAANRVTDVAGNNNLASTSTYPTVILADNTPPSVTVNQSISQIDPTSTLPITFTVMFSEPINTSVFTTSDITQTGTATGITWSIANSGNNQTFTLSATAVSGYGTVIPFIAANRVTDRVGNSNTASTSTDNSVTLLPTTVTVNQAIGQSDPTATLPVNFTVVFSRPIIASSFIAADISQTGTASAVSWSIVDSGDHMNFTLSVTSSGYGTLVPIIAANLVTDVNGISNTLSTSTDNSVTRAFTVTVEQAAGQFDPSTSPNMYFTVIFSTPIDPLTFTPSDVTVNGSATLVASPISIFDSGDHKTFSLVVSATPTGYGTVIPSIPQNRVTLVGVAGTYNLASTSTDNTVMFAVATPTFTITPSITITPTFTRTITPTYTPAKTIVITEVAWMGTAASADDEWIEIFNASNAPVDLTGWQIRSFRSGSGDQVFAVIPLSPLSSVCTPDCIIAPGEFFLLERTDDNTVKDIDADIIYPNSITFGGTSHSTQLSNSGEMLLLCTPNNISAGTCKPSQGNLYITVGDIVNIQTITNGTPASSNLWPGGSSSTLGSMERQSLISNEDTTWFTHTGASPRWGQDANNNNIKGTPKHPNWAYTVTATPRPTSTPQKTATPVPQPAPILVLNEFVPRPGHDWNSDGQVNTLDEFVEVVNAGQVPVNLSQYKLDDYEEDINGVEIKNGFSLPSRTLQPGEIAVFYASDTGFFLSDAGDTVRLVKASNYTVVDAVNYSAVKSLDVSYCRYTDGYGSWLNRCFPTPGLPNSLTGGSFPPEPGGAVSNICLLPDNAPVEFVMAECEQSGLDIWNPEYWDSFPGEGDEFWLYELWYKWLEIFQ